MLSPWASRIGCSSRHHQPRPGPTTWVSRPRPRWRAHSAGTTCVMRPLRRMSHHRKAPKVPEFSPRSMCQTSGNWTQSLSWPRRRWNSRAGKTLVKLVSLAQLLSRRNSGRSHVMRRSA
ncbi:hypothetical protein [Nannocystis pusilla]|uniref:hypothetical protein n=1 Tax=Nannocystis pusilla TaxID=889268 RepID=UPI003B7D2256